ncbi:MAG: PAS domain-containing protein [Usitatibacter sp.]
MNDHDLYDAFELQVWTADASGLLKFVNAFTAAYFGRPREQLVGEGWQNMLHSADLPRAVERWTESLRTGAVYHLDFRLLRAFDRTYRWHHASARRVQAPGGAVWIGSNVDFDAQRRAEEILDSYRVKARGSAEGG